MGQILFVVRILRAAWVRALPVLISVSVCMAQAPLVNSTDPGQAELPAEPLGRGAADQAVLDENLAQFSQADVAVSTMEAVVRTISRQENKVQFAFSEQAAKQSDRQVSSKPLSLAKIVPTLSPKMTAD